MEHTDHDHSMHTAHKASLKKEYLKFSAVIVGIIVIALLHATFVGFDALQFIRSFMGAFLVVFASFKLLNLQMFAIGFSGYDVLARKVLAYGYAYPFIQLTLGAMYLIGVTNIWLDVVMLGLSLFSSIGVLKEMGRPIKCACLGNFVQLPLSTISFIEDFGMAALALVMIISVGVA